MGKACPNFEWFHLGCVDLSEDTIPEVWLCSDLCRQTYLGAGNEPKQQNKLEKASWEYPYCVCHKDKGKHVPMIGGSAGKKVFWNRMVPLSCVGITSPPKYHW